MSKPRDADPILTANLYCQGHLDDALGRVAAPLLERMRQTASESYLWTVRFARRGQHLKLRLHAPQGEQGDLRDVVEALVGEFLDDLEPAGTDERSQSSGPAIDPEDEPEQPHRDRSLLWTTYRRSHVSLGGEPFLSSDEYAARMTECLGRGCELVLATAGAMSSDARQKTVIKALLSGLPAAGFANPESAVAYLRYHRDWLLRFFLQDESEEREVLERFGRQLERMASTVKQLRQIGLGDAPSGDDGTGSWPTSLMRLRTYLDDFREHPDYQTDPFAPDATHPPVFKVFHGTSNQAGLSPFEEAFIHHLLIAALAGEEAAGRKATSDNRSGQAA